MNKHHTIALYLLVISNFLGLLWMKSDVNKVLFPQDYTEHVSILDSNVTMFDDNPYLNLKLRNDADVRVRDINILVTVSGTNGTTLCTLEDSFYFTIPPQSEREVSMQLSYSQIRNIGSLTFKPIVGSAESY